MVKIIDVPDDSEELDDDTPVWEKTTFGAQYMREINPDTLSSPFAFDVSRRRWRTW